MKQKSLIAIVGPTAIGKTAISIEIAKKLNTEIISADSRQFYVETSIGTAKPSNSELSSIKHHFINNLSIKDPYNVGDYEEEVLRLLDQLFLKYDNLILTGGSGLYINAICNGFDALPEGDPLIREELNNDFKKNGILNLQELLKLKDPLLYNKIDLNNPQRIIRALEVCLKTGHPFSSYQKGIKKDRNFNILKIGLHTERAMLYNQINARVDKMMEDGLEAEARSLYPNRELNALNTVGYKELFEYFEGKINLMAAVDLIKQNTRRYAKRQITWFKKDPEIKWFTPLEIDNILHYIFSQKHA